MSKVYYCTDDSAMGDAADLETSGLDYPLFVAASDHDATVAELRAELERVRGELERMRALNKASHAVLAHAFGAHEMQWSERCVRCGQTDSVLNDAPCTALTPKEPV